MAIPLFWWQIRDLISDLHNAKFLVKKLSVSMEKYDFFKAINFISLSKTFENKNSWKASEQLTEKHLPNTA